MIWMVKETWLPESPPGHRFTEVTPGTATDRGEPEDGVALGLLKFLWEVPTDPEERLG